ncbi:MAG: glycosyltransferase family 2 protein [Nitrospira sp.]|nr:glycosyltransferase family 2 protein [Nitrospira sp.]
MPDCTTPLISIGIPTYNRANTYLRCALRSAVNQTYKNIEIIVSDNCSLDNTESVVKEFDDPRIRYYRQKENIGPVNNRNFCLERAQGKYFVLLSDDDQIDDDFISACMDAVKYREEPGVILTGVREIDSEGNILSTSYNTVGGHSTGDFILGWFDRKLPLYLCSTVFNTKRLKQLGGIRSKANKYDDVVAYVKLAAKYGRVDVFDIKASFRRHGSNIGDEAHYSAWCEDSLYLLDVMCNVAPDHEAVIRERGTSYFCHRNYSRVAGIRSPVKRLHAYLTVYRTFNYSCSPVKFVCMRNISRGRKFLKRQFQSCRVL